MTNNQIAKKYSHALMSMTIADMPLVLKELQSFSKLLEIHRQLKLLFAGRIFTDDEQLAALDSLLQRLEFGSASGKFIKLVIAHGQLAAFKEIVHASEAAFNRQQNRVVATVTAPVKLDIQYIDKLKIVIENMTSKEVDIESRIDPDLLGGFVVNVGSTTYDSSVKGQLRLLRDRLVKSG
ncbi:MAG: ATP synthase F1 subunit delta [Nitrospira sp.]|nr:ATP synthase F1 subunit delta [bacterium]MBL7048667.1 ATP synthase F1 subunit delta [Nitrospira sp.]